MIRLTQYGRPVYVSAFHVVTVRPAVPRGSHLRFSTGDGIEVEESPDEIAKYCKLILQKIGEFSRPE